MVKRIIHTDVADMNKCVHFLNDVLDYNDSTEDEIEEK